MSIVSNPLPAGVRVVVLLVGAVLAGGVQAADAAPAAEPAKRAGEPAAGAAPEPGVWLHRVHTLTYIGLTSYYSCQGLKDKVRLLLLAAGARKDAKVYPSGCEEGLGRIAQFPRAQLDFYVLAPAADAPPATPAAPLPAAAPAHRLGRDAPKLRKDPPPPEFAPGVWRSVELRDRSPRDLEAGDCELVVQFAREVLPLFTVRDVQERSRCVPHQVSHGDVRLSFTTLGPLPDADVRGRPADAAVSSPRP